MKKGLVFAAALIAAGSTAASAEVVFKGTIKITAVTAQCQNIHVNDSWNSRFHPLIAEQSDNSEGITFVYSHGGIGYTLAGHIFDTTFRTVQTGGLGWGGVYLVPNANRAKVALTVRPAINASTQTLVLKGKIQRPDEDPGGLACEATFIAVYLKDQ